jgi:hypothetical protein
MKLSCTIASLFSRMPNCKLLLLLPNITEQNFKNIYIRLLDGEPNSGSGGAPRVTSE